MIPAVELRSPTGSRLVLAPTIEHDEYIEVWLHKAGVGGALCALLSPLQARVLAADLVARAQLISVPAAAGDGS